MKTLRWAIATSLVGGLFAGTAMAQVTMSYPVQQPSSIQQMGYQQDDTAGYAVADPAPAGAAITPASPSNQPPAPPATKAKADDKPAAEAPKDEGKKDEEKKEDDKPAEEGPVKLFHGPWLDCEHLDIRGFADVGAGLNPNEPINRFNGPIGYDDRANEVQLNQLYLTAERLAKVENDCGVDYGYRADLLYGTDRRFIQTTPGSDWDGSWNAGNRFYGLIIPQLYGTLQYNKLTLEGGHFYAPVGYEVANADGNFFYSHTYQFLYGEPTTLTGGFATYKLKDKLLVNAGIDTGWNEGFKALNGRPNFFFGANWTSKDDKINVIEEVFIGNTQPAGVDDSTRVLFNTVVTAKLGDKWHYALETNFANDSDTALASGGNGSASWWGMTNYLLYDINDCWGFGFRYEYFEDINGAVVTQVGPPTIAETGSKWNDLTLGLNWKPNKNVTMRTEARWDWASNNAGAGAKPFADGNSDGQFTWGNDVIIRF
jgi:hypothetical protein